jgi:hypothetical protein
VVGPARHLERLRVLEGRAQGRCRQERQCGLLAQLVLQVRTPHIQLVVLGQSYTMFESTVYL